MTSNNGNPVGRGRAVEHGQTLQRVRTTGREPEVGIGTSGFEKMFVEDRITVGLFFPLEAYEGTFPTMRDQARLARRAEALGFAALWFRDVPLHDPNFGDVGQIYDPWVYMGYVAAHTERIALATGSIVATLRHPLHLAKAAASVDRLSDGRLVMGLASGDRPVEYPAFGVDFGTRGERFRETFSYLERALGEDFPEVDSPLGRMEGLDLVPKPVSGRIPALVVGNSRQTPEWIAEHADGWMYYTRTPRAQGQEIEKWRELVEGHAPGAFKPFGQASYLDLAEDPDAPLEHFFRGQGHRLGRNRLLSYIEELRGIGVNHLSLNLKYSRRPAPEVIEELGEEVLPHLSQGR